MQESCYIPIPVGNNKIKKMVAQIKGNIFNFPLKPGEYYYLMFGATTMEEIHRIQKEGDEIREKLNEKYP